MGLVYLFFRGKTSQGRIMHRNSPGPLSEEGEAADFRNKSDPYVRAKVPAYPLYRGSAPETVSKLCSSSL
jgi:hypothetical protein